MAEEFDVAKLDRAKIVILEYAGRRNRRKNQGEIFIEAIKQLMEPPKKLIKRIGF